MSHYHLLQESVALTLVNGNDRIDRNAIVDAIAKIIPVAEVESFGNLGDHNKWFIIFKSTLFKEKFLKLENLKVNDQVFAIHKPYREVKLIRLLNIPPSVSEDNVREIAMKWGGTVISVECETLPRPYSSIKTFVRRIRMRFSSPDDEQNIPISIKILGITIPILLEGRVKVCYRCKQSGHVKSECTTLKCQVCSELGHDDIACTKKRLYASVVGASPKLLVTPTMGIHGFKPTTTSTKVHPRIKICHKCKQPGHVKKDCSVDQHGAVQSSTPLPSEDIISRFSTPTVFEGEIGDDVQGGVQDKVHGDAQAGAQSIVQGGDHAGVVGDVHAGALGDVRAGVLGNFQDNDEQGVGHTGVQGGSQAEVQSVDQAGLQRDNQHNVIEEDVDIPHLAATDGRDEPVVVLFPGEPAEETQSPNPQQTTPIQPRVTSNANDVGACRGLHNLSDIEAYKAFKEGRGILKRPLSDEQHPIIKDSKKQHQPTSPSERVKEKEDGEL